VEFNNFIEIEKSMGIMIFKYLKNEEQAKYIIPFNDREQSVAEKIVLNND